MAITAPDFEADTTEGRIKFHDWIGDAWAVLFSHPKDFTPVCTTELGYMAKIKPEFDKRNVKIIGISVDPVDQPRQVGGRHQGDAGARAELPDDRRPRRSRSPSSTACCRPRPSGSSEGRTPADNQTVRNVFVVGPDKKIKLVLVYPMTTGRNFDEVLRVIDSLQLTAKHKVATPVNWKDGEDVIIAGSVSDDDAKKSTPRAGRRPSRTSASCRSRVSARHRRFLRSAAAAALLRSASAQSHCCSPMGRTNCVAPGLRLLASRPVTAAGVPAPCNAWRRRVVAT